MRNKEFDAFLDDGTRLPEVPDEKELALILREVESLPDEQPVATYWDHFNQRLHARIDATQAKPGWWSRFRYALWPSLALAAVLLFVVLRPITVDPSLELLSNESLQFIASIYELEEEASGIDVAESDMDLLLDSMGNSGDPLDLLDEIELPSGEELKELLNLEG